MKGYVYVLLSDKDKRTYVGSTDNIERRISEHIRGTVESTKHRLPLRLIYKEEYDSISEARKKEEYLKTCSGRKRLYDIINQLINK